MDHLAVAKWGAGLYAPDLFLLGTPAEAPLRPENLLSVWWNGKGSDETLP